MDAEFPTPLSMAISGGCAHVRIAGDVDLLTTRDIRTGLKLLLEQGVRSVEIDLLDAARIDSAAVEALRQARERVAQSGGSFHVVSGNASLADALTRSGVEVRLR